MTLMLRSDEPRAAQLADAIRRGDVTALREQLAADPPLAHARIIDDRGVSRTPLLIAADWPGHFANAAESVAVLIAAGGDVDAVVQHTRCAGAPETALHWAASSDDVSVLDALLDGGADIEAPGASYTGGSPMSDAVVFAQWRAARRLLERGARTTLWQAAALGQLDAVREMVSATPRPSAENITNACWHACRGGQLAVTQFLVECGADLHWVGYDSKTPIDAARDSGAPDLLAFLATMTG